MYQNEWKFIGYSDEMLHYADYKCPLRVIIFVEMIIGVFINSQKKLCS